MPIFQMNMSYVDAYQRRGTKSYELDALDYPTALTNAAAFVVVLAAAMMADILKYAVCTEVLVTDTVDALANKDEGVTISTDLGGGKTAALKIPTPVKSYINPDGTVDMADAIITNVEAFYTDGKVLISDGETVLDFLSGKLDK